MSQDDTIEKLERSLLAGLIIRPLTEAQVQAMIDSAIDEHERRVERKGYTIAGFVLSVGAAIGFLLFFLVC
jgi:Sec-independent protein secretion pathway component TatC